MTDKVIPLDKKGEWSEMGKTAALAILLALILRTFAFEPFNIPSGSMYPTLMVGDYLFVSKSAYGYSRYSFPLGLGGFDGRIFKSDGPKRGDVVVFKLPTDTRIDYIKRVIGLPGDTVQVIGGQLYINDAVVPREAVGMVAYQEYSNGPTQDVMQYKQTLPNGKVIDIYERGDNEALDNTPKFTVPEGHYFMMGDNRDNSQDSRVPELVGFVPLDNLVGRAKFMFFSTNGHAMIWEIWKWPFAIRYGRLFQGIE